MAQTRREFLRKIGIAAAVVTASVVVPLSLTSSIKNLISSRDLVARVNMFFEILKDASIKRSADDENANKLELDILEHNPPPPPTPGLEGYDTTTKVYVPKISEATRASLRRLDDFFIPALYNTVDYRDILRFRFKSKPTNLSVEDLGRNLSSAREHRENFFIDSVGRANICEIGTANEMYRRLDSLYGREYPEAARRFKEIIRQIAEKNTGRNGIESYALVAVELDIRTYDRHICGQLWVKHNNKWYIWMSQEFYDVYKKRILQQ